MIDKENSFGQTNEFDNFDKLGRTVFHKCCLEQNPRILNLNINKLMATAKDEDKARELVKMQLNKTDIYNNTPLLLACIYDNEAKSFDR